MDLGEHVGRFRFLVRDRAGQFAASFDAVLTDADIGVVKIRRGGPRANMLIFGAAPPPGAGRVRRARQHAAAASSPPATPTAPGIASPDPVLRRIGRRPVLGGLINQYATRSLKPQISCEFTVVCPGGRSGLPTASARLVR